jgi:hypothetical protein
MGIIWEIQLVPPFKNPITSLMGNVVGFFFALNAENALTNLFWERVWFKLV